MNKKLKAYCLIEFGEENEFPEFYKTKKECILSNTSYYGSEFDNPLKRGVVCTVNIEINIPKFKPSKGIISYLQNQIGSPGLLVLGDDDFNKKQTIRHNKSIYSKLNKLMKDK